MRLLAAIVFAIIIFFVPKCASADTASFRYGLGIIGQPTSQVKNFGLRYEEDSGLYDIHLAVEGGIWTDTGSAQGRNGAIYGQYQVGIRPSSENIYAKAYWGIAGLSGTDSQLGGVIQFGQDLGVGFQGKGSFVGLQYKHISSAGVFSPNKGRDFVGAEMGVRF